MPAASQPSAAPWELSRWCFGEQCPRETAAERGLAQPCLLFLPAGDGGAFADRRGRGGCGFPPSLRPLPGSCSYPGVAGPGAGSGTGGRAVPGHRLISRGRGGVSNEGAALCHPARGCVRVPAAPGVKQDCQPKLGHKGQCQAGAYSCPCSSPAVQCPPLHPPAPRGPWEPTSRRHQVKTRSPHVLQRGTPCPQACINWAAPGQRLSPPCSLHPSDPGGWPLHVLQVPFSLRRVLRRDGGEAVSSVLPKMVSPACPSPRPQKILQVLSTGAP